MTDAQDSTRQDRLYSRVVSEGDALDLELAIDRVFYELKDAGFPVVSVHLAAAATLSEQFQTIEDHLTCLIVYRAAAS